MAALREAPGSLQFDRGEVLVPPDLDNPIGRAMLRMMGFESKRSKLLHGAQRLYGAVMEHVDAGVLQRAFQTGKLFWSTYVLLSLHVWLVIHRLHASKHAEVRFFRQQFYNEFQRDVEYRVYAAGVQVGVSKWLKKLEMHFYETGYELDQAVAGKDKDGNPVAPRDALIDVILRKYYGNEAKHREDAELLAAYLTREMQCLAATDEEAVFRGHVNFSLRALAGALRRAGVTSPAEDEAQDAGAGEAEGGKARGGVDAEGAGLGLREDPSGGGVV